MAVTIDAGDVEDIRPTDKPDVGLPSGGGSARAGLRQAPGIPGPPVPVGGRHWRIALVLPPDSEVAPPLPESMD